MTTIIRSAVVEDRQRLANLIHFELMVHRHLDWRAPLDWIGSEPYLVYEQRKDLLAVLACPPDPLQVAWIRLFAVAGNHSVEQAWTDLWREARARLGDMPEAKYAVALVLWPWLIPALEASGFTEENRVVMLTCQAGRPLPFRQPGEVIIRPMNFDDLAAVHAVDNAAFSLIWQNSAFSLELAYRQAAVATVADLGGRLVGYQISTPTPAGGHLARLAVLPECQGTGIGFALLSDVLQQFRRRGAQKITVNTQKDNPASLRIYQKAGFQLTGEEYPVYLHSLA